MCLIWGYAQGWWSVWGLVFDIVGFAILALDVMREYMRHVRARSLDEGARAAEWLIRDRDIEEHLSSYSDLKELRKDLIETRRMINWAMLRTAELKEENIKSLKSLEEKVQSLQAASQRELVRPFKRAPIYTGIVFVIVGFILQVVGAIPCS